MINQETNQPPAVREYTIKGNEHCELPDGLHVTLIPCPVETGQLAMFDQDGCLITGRWYPDLLSDGDDYILQPGRLVRVVAEAPVRVLGVVVPSEDPPKEIGYQPGDERFYENRFPRSLAC